jgi:hypothetical protein
VGALSVGPQQEARVLSAAPDAALVLVAGIAISGGGVLALPAVGTSIASVEVKESLAVSGAGTELDGSGWTVAVSKMTGGDIQRVLP